MSMSDPRQLDQQHMVGGENRLRLFAAPHPRSPLGSRQLMRGACLASLSNWAGKASDLLAQLNPRAYLRARKATARRLKALRET